MNNKCDLSVLIPANKEEFLDRTIQDVLQHSKGNTEVIAILDGYLPNPSLTSDPRVTVIYNPVAVGQRAATNQAAKIARGKYVMKLDAHCAVDEGFDVKMLDAFKKVGDNVTMIPTMKNLHVFDWVCPDGHRRYQGLSGVCNDCGKPTVKDIVWFPKKSPNTFTFRFDKTMHFQYFGELAKTAENRKGALCLDGTYDPQLRETLSIQGSSFMITKENYFKWDICSETDFHSWGQQGVEVALKTHLSRGRVISNLNTWHAHMFRTKGGDFGFPYSNPQKLVNENREVSRKLFLDNTWKLQIYPISYVLKKFWPVPDWTDEDLGGLIKKEINTERSGIYLISNKTTGKIYVGSAINIKNRLFEHTRKLSQKDHANAHLQNAYDKYGANDFEFNVLFFCKEDELLEHEQSFIDEYKSKIGWENMFNISPTAGSSLGRELSEETKKKISESKIGGEPWNKGLTKDTNIRIKEYADKKLGIPQWTNDNHPKGFLGKNHSEESKQKTSESMKNIPHIRNEWGQFDIIHSKGMIYYTDNQLDEAIAKPVRDQLLKISEEKKINIVSSSLKKMDFGVKNIHFPSLKRGYLSMFKQIMAALENSRDDIIFFTEHDILYHPSHFDFTPPDKNTFYYNQNVWYLRRDGHALHYDVNQVSGICVYREAALTHYRERYERLQKEEFTRNMGFEPFTHNRVTWKNKFNMDTWMSESPNVDLRVELNPTGMRWRKDQYRNQQLLINWTESENFQIPNWNPQHLKDILICL